MVFNIFNKKTSQGDLVKEKTSQGDLKKDKTSQGDLKEDKNSNFQRLSKGDLKDIEPQPLSKTPSSGDNKSKRMSVYDEIKLTNLPPPDSEDIADHLKKDEVEKKNPLGNLANLYQFKTLSKEKGKEIIKEKGLDFAKWIDYALGSTNSTLCYNPDPKKPHMEFGIESDGFGLILHVLENNSNIQNLILSNQEITERGMKDVSEFLEKNQTLKSLNLSKNFLDIGCNYLCEGLKANKGLKELNISHNFLEKPHITTLSDILKSNSTIEILNLSNNKLMFDGAELLSKGLKSNKSLTELYLASNNIGYYGAYHIAEYLEKNKSLKVLDISNNDIGDKGAKYIAFGLRNGNKTLERINVSKNNINEKGFAFWVNKKKSFAPSLVYVNLSENPLVSPKIVYNLIKYNTGIKELDISFTELGKDAVEALVEEIEKKDLKVKVNFYGNGYFFPIQDIDEDGNPIETPKEIPQETSNE